MNLSKWPIKCLLRVLTYNCDLDTIIYFRCKNLIQYIKTENEQWVSLFVYLFIATMEGVSFVDALVIQER